jgi:hypothetical protein
MHSRASPPLVLALARIYKQPSPLSRKKGVTFEPLAKVSEKDREKIFSAGT